MIDTPSLRSLSEIIVDQIQRDRELALAIIAEQRTLLIENARLRDTVDVLKKEIEAEWRKH